MDFLANEATEKNGSDSAAAPLMALFPRHATPQWCV